MMIGKKNRRFKKCLSLLLTLLMLVTAVPFHVSAETTSSPESEIMNTEGEVSTAPTLDKISDNLKIDMESKDEVEIIVYMKAKLDAITFAEKAFHKYSFRMSKHDANLQVRRDLVIALQDQTHRSQYNLRKLVEASENEVSDFQSFFIANVAYMKASTDFVEKVAALEEVEKITKNESYQLEDYRVDKNLKPQEGEYLWSLEMVRAPETWGVGIDGNGAVVGLLDSGTDYYHPALTKQWRGLDADGNEDATYSWFDTVGNEPLPVDSDIHGTHVCGTMVGKDEEANIVTGVAPGAKWISARVFNPQGFTSDQQLISAAEWMIAPGGNPDMAPDVVNNSWGGAAGINDWYLESVDNYVAAGIVPVFSAGNRRQDEPVPEPGSIACPSNYANSLAVGAIDENKLRGSFSKRGPSPYTEEWKPEMSAPGVGVISAIAGGGYGGLSGTSMASPHISGVIALIRSANDSLSVSDIRSLLFQNAEPLTDNDPNAQTSPNHDYGYGLVDALESVLPIKGGIGTFTGKVLRRGEDLEAPVITHEQVETAVYLGSSLELEAEITDDISVVEASLMVKPEDGTWEELPLRQAEGGTKGGIFRAYVDAEYMGTGDSFEYKFVAKDFGEHVSESEVYTVEIIFGVTPGEYFESFEGSAEGWLIDPLWEIGSPVLTNEPEVPHGEEYIATAIGSNYGANDEALLVSAPIDMRNVTEASVRFKHWFNFGDWLGDGGMIFVTNDFGETLDEYGSFVLNSDGWLGEVIDLRPYANSPTPVHILFYFYSDDYSHYLGWYLDMFEVEGVDTTAPDAPTNLEVVPGLSSFKLSWDFEMVPDFEEFEIYRSTSAAEEGELVDRTTYQVYHDAYGTEILDDTDYYYTIKAKDMFGNLSEASNQVVVRKADSTTIAAWDFENNDGGFTTGVTDGTANDWEWGEVDPNHGPGGAYSGSKVWATGLDHNYSNEARAYLQTPSFTLPEGGSSFLTMNHWYSFERESADGNKWHYGQILIKKTDQEEYEWVNITPPDEGEAPGEGKFGGPAPGEDNFWRQLELDISSYAGSEVELRFYYFTDEIDSRPGWFINDISIVNVADIGGAAVASCSCEQNEIKEKVSDLSFNFAQIGRAEPEEFTLEESELATIPVIDGRVSVVETGQSVVANNRTAIYNMKHKSSEDEEKWTLKAEAYGYEPAFFETALADEEILVHDFILEEQETGRIEGRVYDRYSQDPASYATIKIVEDPYIEPVIADENGNFVIERVYIGDYTLHAVAEDFDSGTVEVTVSADQTTNCDIALKRFVGIPGEIRYDDGDADEGTVLIRPGGGIALRITPEKRGKLLNASFYFWDETWPEPGGNEMGFAVFVEDGLKYKQIGQTKVFDDIVRGDWYTVDFSDLNFSTDEDFYVTTVQTQDGDHSPGYGLDTSAAYASDRSYFFIDGSFRTFKSQKYDDFGAMIRATLEYDADAPVITNLDDINYTNEDSVDIEGTVEYDQGQVLLYADDQLIETIEPEEILDHNFSSSLNLAQEVTSVKASLKVDGKETEPSAEKIIIKDQLAPELIVSEPYDGEHLNVELVHVRGNVTEKYLDRLTINGTEVPVEEDGSYDYKLILSIGENPVEIKAIDKAGNESIENLTVYVANDDVHISDMQPAHDITVVPGDKVEVSFHAPANGEARYAVIAPTGLFNFELDQKTMVEVEPGFYKATWIAGVNEFAGGEVKFSFKDAFGNRTKATAAGKITVKQTNVVDRLFGSNRYKTAVKMSQFTYEQASTVILASGENFPDALLAGPYAEKINAPVLLSRRGKLPASTLSEIKRLRAKEVKILGGNLAISQAVEKSLIDEGLTVERIAGSNRFATAVEISERARAKESKHVFLVNAYHFADGLSIAPVAAQLDDAILLTKTDSLNKVTLDALEAWGTETITIMGGHLAVSKQVENELKALGYQVERIQGSNRYKTNIYIAREYFPDATRAVGVTGADFPDAMIATAYAAKEGRPIILLDPEGLRDITAEYFAGEPVAHVLLLGGELAVPALIEYHIVGLISDK